MTVTYLVGDVREVMATIADDSVDLLATSPPFLALRSYLPAGHDQKHAEIGSEANPAAYIDMLLNLTTEWGRVLAPHGSIAIELGDTYSGSGGAGGDYNEGGLRDGQQKFKQSGWGGYEKSGYHGGATIEGYRKDDGTEVDLPRAPRGGGTGWPRAKSLALIPQLYAVALAYGINPLTGAPSPAGRWLVRNIVVWHRPNPAVGALGDKVRPSTSYIVIATRSPKRWFDLTAVRTAYGGNGEPPERKQNIALTASFSKGNTWDGEKMMKSNPAGAPPNDTWFDSDSHEYDYRHDTWTLTTQPSGLAHYAMWPAKLAERLILMMCPHAVCRECGEPRRRVEGKTPEYAEFRRQVNDAERPIGEWDLAVGNRANGFTGKIASSSDTSAPERGPKYETLGWTDCGCTCPTCHGTRQIGHDHKLKFCPDCTDGRAPFRPGLVLDPFVGSGTTCCTAELLRRDSIGIDLDPRNREIFPRRMEEVKRALFGTKPEMPNQLGMFDEVPA